MQSARVLWKMSVGCPSVLFFWVSDYLVSSPVLLPFGRDISENKQNENEEIRTGSEFT